MSAVLEDLLMPGLKVVFCGTAVGRRSARVGAYFAGRGNKFWGIIHKIGLTPRLLRPEEYRELLWYGIGLTDLAKTRAGPDRGLKAGDFDRDGLTRKVVAHRPKLLCFNGKRAARAYFRKKELNYGRQDEVIGVTAVYVLPSTSAAAGKYWDERYWWELAACLRELGAPARESPPFS